MTLLDLPNSVAQSVLDAMLPGLEAEHGSPSSMTRDDTGGFILEWRRGRETLQVSIAAEGPMRPDSTIHTPQEVQKSGAAVTASEHTTNAVANAQEEGPKSGVCVRADCFGRYGVFSPYESHDGPVGWTVQRLEPGEDPSRQVIAEFADEHDALLFAEAKFEDEDSARLDKLRDKYEPDVSEAEQAEFDRLNVPERHEGD